METGWQDRYRERVFFTWSEQETARGFEMVAAEGARFQLASGEWIWDLESQIYNVAVGHRHPRVQARMIEQIQTLPVAHPHALLPVRLELAESLYRLSGLPKAFFTTGGSEAVENAIKIARLVTGRGKIVARRHSYHGATLAVLGVAGDSRRQPFAQDLPAPYWIDDPYPAREAGGGRSSDWLQSLQELLAREGAESVAAILLEGMTGAGGMQTPPADFWPGARELCDRHGILLIADEIFSGCGRTGRWWGHQHWGGSPDILVLGKGLTSGYAPLGATLVSQVIAGHFAHRKLWCGLTQFAHPVSCAAAVASLRVIEDERLVENAARVGEALARRLAGIADRPGFGDRVRDLRGRGLMQAVVFDRPTAALTDLLWKAGVFAPVVGEMLLICPPLCLTEPEMHEAIDRVESALRLWRG